MRSNSARKIIPAILASFLLAPSALSALDFVFPPELQWWLDEARKANPSIKLEDFRLNESEGAAVPITEIPGQGGIYPVLRKWNYSGDRYAYYDLYSSLSRLKDGRYEVLRDIDSAKGIFNRTAAALYSESFGSSKGLNALAWVRDGVLVATGIWIDSKPDGRALVDLVIREYSISEKDVRVRGYVYRDAFDSDVRAGLRLTWWSQRPDYFSP